MLSGRRQAGPRTATIEFDAELWEAIESAASRLGVSAAEYIQAAVARVAAEGTRQAGGPEQFRRARLARAAAAETRDEARALHAQGGQAMRRAQELAAVRDEVDPGLRNIAYVKLLWEACKAGGVAAVAELVPSGVEWWPIAGEGRNGRASQDLAEFWSSREIERVTPRMFHVRNDDVLVEAGYQGEGDDRRTLWLVYHFQSGRLVEAISLSDEAAARRYNCA